MTMSKDQVEARKREVEKEKARIRPKFSKRNSFRKKYLKQSYDPSHLMT